MYEKVSNLVGFTELRKSTEAGDFLTRVIKKLKRRRNSVSLSLTLTFIPLVIR